MNTISTQTYTDTTNSIDNTTNSIDNTTNSIDVTFLNDLISNQKKYFTMYITNKSAEMAKNFENEVKNIINTSLTDEINKIVIQHINKITLKFDSEINEIKETLESAFSFEQEKLGVINCKLEKLQTSFYTDISEYIDVVINKQIKNCIDNTLNKTSKFNHSDTFIEMEIESETNTKTEMEMEMEIEKKNMEQQEVVEITNLLQEIDQIKTDIHKIIQIKDLKDQINIALSSSSSSSSPNKDIKVSEQSSFISIQTPKTQNFTIRLTEKISNIGLCFKNSISENVSLSIHVNKYSTLLLSSLAITFMISQII